MKKYILYSFFLLLIKNAISYQLFVANDTNYMWKLEIYLSGGHYGGNYYWKPKDGIYGETKSGPFFLPPYSWGSIQALIPGLHSDSLLCWHKVHAVQQSRWGSKINLKKHALDCSDLYVVIEDIGQGHYKAVVNYSNAITGEAGDEYYDNYLNAHSADMERKAFNLKHKQILESIKKNHPECYKIMDGFSKEIQKQREYLKAFEENQKAVSQKDKQKDKKDASQQKQLKKKKLQRAHPSQFEKKYESWRCDVRTKYLVYVMLPDSYIKGLKKKITEKELKTKYPDAYWHMQNFKLALLGESLRIQGKTTQEIEKAQQESLAYILRAEGKSESEIKKRIEGLIIKMPSFYAEQYEDLSFAEKTGVPIYWILPTSSESFKGVHKNAYLGIRLIGQVDAPGAESDEADAEFSNVNL